MLTPRSRKLYLPAFALVVAILGATSLMLVTHLRALSRERERMERELRLQSSVIVRTLESGARAGMMMRWGSEQLQALLEEAVSLGEIAYVGIFDERGTPVAAASEEGQTPPWPQAGDVRRILEGSEPVFEKRDIAGRGVIEISQRFVPRRVQRPRGRMMGGMMIRPRDERRAGEDPEWAVVLGLHTGPWEEVLQEGRRQALLSLLVLVGSGSIAIYVGIVLQNYFVVRRTLVEMKTYAQEVLENMADGLISVDGDGRVATYNHEALRLLGRTDPSMRGFEIRTLLPEAGDSLDAVLRGSKEREEAEILLARGKAERTVGVAVSPLRSEEGHILGAVILLRDLSEVRRLQKKIQDAEKLAAIGQMAATVAHEIRNPLSSLKGFAQLFEGKFEAGSAEGGYARLMVREVDRLNRTVSDLLFYSRPLRLHRERVDVADLLRETAKLLGPEAEARPVGIEASGEVPVQADPDQLRRVFLNILLNARQAAGGEGTVTVTVSPDGSGGCRVVIADDGRGMSAEEASRAFEPFFSTREKGSGLGLAIVKKIVDLHGGSVDVASEPGRGTEVTVTLPPPED